MQQWLAGDYRVQDGIDVERIRQFVLALIVGLADEDPDNAVTAFDGRGAAAWRAADFAAQPESRPVALAGADPAARRLATCWRGGRRSWDGCRPIRASSARCRISANYPRVLRQRWWTRIPGRRTSRSIAAVRQGEPVPDRYQNFRPAPSPPSKPASPLPTLPRALFIPCMAW